MATDLTGKRVAFLVAPKGTEHDELVKPLEAVREAGAEAVLVSSEAGPVTTNRHDLEPGETLEAQLGADGLNADEFDAVVIPGGTVGADKLRADARLVAFVRDLMAQRKPVAAICHGPWVLVEADAVRGRKLTSYHSLRTDVRNAGGDWVDQEVVVDQGLVTSRKPDDIPAFTRKVLEEIGEGVHAGRRG
ncbi:MAG: type 1 glutamine amidotransferase [Deinococcales bacterium]|nr:type 1 glutamine amidotransferase [Deinococcales bacterium]